jgi:monoterpene epsilon-lactone hydrolase
MITRRSLASLLALPAALAARAQAPSLPDDPYTTFDPDGTAHIKRAIPVPKTISPEAQTLMMPGEKWLPAGGTKERAAWMEKMQAVYPVDIKDTTVAGAEVWIVTPKHPAPQKHERVLICLHGGGFTSDSGSQIESIPMAALTGTQVISVRYRLAPKFPFPAAVDDTVAVYREAMKTHTPKNIGVYGTSAGAVLAAQVTVQFRKLGLPLPAALGFFSGYVDLARYGDSRFLYGSGGLKDFNAMIEPLKGLGMVPYVGDHDRKDPALSPMYADMKGFPPTLCMTSTRDHCLSGTVDFHRALLRAGVDARLMVFDALPHAFWYQFDLPESREALEAQASFLNRHLGP